jgi:RNA polymerase sigma-70 factor, ECF subfamily
MPPDLSITALAEFFETRASLLDRLHVESDGARWGVSRQDLAQALLRSASNRFGGALPGDGALLDYLRPLHLKDLALVCALRRGSASAWEEFVKGYRPVLYAAARAIVGSAGEARARELADSVYAELYGLGRSGSQERRSLLDYFHGRSKLSTWLRAILAQRHVDAIRTAGRTESLDGPLAHVPVAGRAENAVDPDRARLLPRLRQAVASAVAAAPSSDRLLLSLYYLQEMTLARIARLQGVHEATVSRQLDRIRRELRKSVERSLTAVRAGENGLAAQLGLSPAEVQLCFRYALEDWSFDLGAALSVGSAEAEGSREPKY